MSEDMSEIFQKMNDMLKNNEVPDSIKSMLNNFNSNGMSSNSSTEQPNSENNSNDMPNFDMDTMLKMKSIIDNMNRSQNDPRANLLKSLKPYLKPSRKDKVDQYTTYHNQEALPCRFSSELPRLCWLLHLFGIKALVDHARYLAIAAQRQPAHTILGIIATTPETEQFTCPLTNTYIKEDKKLLYPHPEEFGEKHVTTLVQEHQKGDGQYKL